MRPNAFAFACHIVRRNYCSLLFPVGRSLRQHVSVPKQLSSIRRNLLMPRSIEHMLNMQRARQKIKQKSAKYIGNTKVSLQVGIASKPMRSRNGFKLFTNLPLADSGHRRLRHAEMRLPDGRAHQVHLQLWRGDAEIGIRAQVQADQVGACVHNVGDLEQLGRHAGDAADDTGHRGTQDQRARP